MPIKRSSIKDVRRTKTRRIRNVAILSRLRGAVANVDKAKTADEASIAFKAAESLLDKAARKGYIHSNAAARSKSRLAVRAKAKAKA